MSTTTDIHPDAVLEALQTKGTRAQRQRKLAQLHEICRRHHKGGSRDFSLPTIGGLCEAEDVLKMRVLYNATSAEYRELIAAWVAYAGPMAPTPPKTLASHDYLMRIEDPAIRAIMQSIIAERDKLKAVINVLKANAHMTVDRRPLGATVVSNPSAGSTAILMPVAQLTPSEREALEKSISARHLEEQGWREGTHGEILNDKGRVVLDVGFARAIRRILGNGGIEGKP